MNGQTMTSVGQLKRALDAAGADVLGANCGSLARDPDGTIWAAFQDARGINRVGREQGTWKAVAGSPFRISSTSGATGSSAVEEKSRTAAAPAALIAAAVVAVNGQISRL